MTRKYFGTDGIRGRVGVGAMTPEFVLKLGWAAGRVLAKDHSKKLVLIGKDTRISNYMFEACLEAGLSAAGVHSRLLGPMPTPAIAYLTQTLRASAGIVISASHNAYYDNGVKFFSASGQKLPDSVELEIEAQLDQDMVTVDSAELGKAERIDDAAGRYIEFCKRCFPAQQSLTGLKIVVDCANGATYHIAPAVFAELGADVVSIGVSPNGMNINDKCGATAPDLLVETVQQHGADLGVAIDGDGDRLIMVDQRGEIVDGDELLYIIAKAAKNSGALTGGVVGTLMSNLGLELALKDLGIPFARAAVGDRYVMEGLRENSWTLGGESSGHIICLDHTSTGDAIVAALQVLNVMVDSGRTLYELREGLQRCPMTLVNVPLEDSIDLQDQPIATVVAEVEKELGDNGRVLLRKSGTEPLLRVMVEGQSHEQVNRLAEQIAAVVREQSVAA